MDTRENSNSGWLVPAGWVVLLDRLADPNLHVRMPSGRIELVFSTVSQSRVLAAYRIDPPNSEVQFAAVFMVDPIHHPYEIFYTKDADELRAWLSARLNDASVKRRRKK